MYRLRGEPLDDAELIGRARSRDTEAYGQLVRRHQRVALRVAYLITRDAMEAQDIAQDAFVKAYRSLDQFRDGSPFRPWLLRIVHNEAVNRIRRRDRQARLAVRSYEPSIELDPADVASISAERAELLDALGRLPARFREVVALRFLLELSEEETAQTLGLARGTVKSRTARGLDRLRSLLVTHAGEAPDV